MDTLVKEILADSIDMAKVVFKDGLTGQLVLGDQKEIFTLLPEYYSFTSYDIHLADSSEIIKEQEMLKQLAQGYMQSNMMDPEILFIIYNSKSLTEMRELAMKSIREKKIENNQLQQLQQQLEQAQQQQKEMQKQLEASTKKLAQLNERKLNIEQQNNQMDQELGYYIIEKDAELRSRELDIMEQKNKLEMAQLFDTNPNNDEVDYRRT
jgi:DNA repair exonuclease SbcCD ATPase subunit